MSVLRYRKDGLVQLIKDLLSASFVAQARSALASPVVLRTAYAAVLAHVAQLIDDHRSQSEHSVLKELVPSICTFFTPLPLPDAFAIYDSENMVAARCFVPYSSPCSILCDISPRNTNRHLIRHLIPHIDLHSTMFATS